MYMYMYYMYGCTCMYTCTYTCTCTCTCTYACIYSTCIYLSTQGMIDNVLSNQSWSYVSQEFSRNARDPTAPTTHHKAEMHRLVKILDVRQGILFSIQNMHNMVIDVGESGIR